MTEVYSKSADFPNGIAPGQLVNEIEADPGITTQLLGISIDGDVVDIIFVSAISGPEKTALDIVVANHIPSPSNYVVITEGYLLLTSNLADSGAIVIQAADPSGGIDIDAGLGGITVDSTNTISLDAAAESNFSTSNGNLNLRAAVGLLNIDGGAGINIGNTGTTGIYMGTSSVSKTITIGNQTGATIVEILTGTGGFIVDTANGGPISLDATGTSSNFTLTTNGNGQDLTFALTGFNDSSIIIDSQGTGSDAVRINGNGGIDVDSNGQINLTSTSTAADAIRLNSGGGLDADFSGTINFATSDATGGAITFDAAFGGGGIVLSSGAQGIAINANGGLIGIGQWSGGNISIGTAAVARIINIGNTTGTTSLIMSSGTGGLILGNDANGGEIQIGNVANAKTITVGNGTGASRLFTRWGAGGNIVHQPAETGLSDADGTLTTSHLFSQIITMTPTADRTLTLPTAADIVAAVSGVQIGDAFDFRIMNLDSASGNDVIIAMGSGGTAIGHMTVEPYNNGAGTYFYSGTGIFRLRFTNVTVSSEAYTVYRFG